MVGCVVCECVCVECLVVVVVCVSNMAGQAYSVRAADAHVCVDSELRGSGVQWGGYVRVLHVCGVHWG